jgi:uncharacterized protein
VPVLDPVAAVLVALAGLAAGAINAVVGSGSLITFPALLFLGFPPLVANVSNTIGLAPGAITGAIGYRRELTGQRRRALPLLVAGGAGGLTGSTLLLAFPSDVFERVVPFLILLAVAMVWVQPHLTRRLGPPPPETADGGRPGYALLAGVYATGIYGGYFGAGQGVILIALLAALIADRLQRLNALKNAIAGVINGVAAVLLAIAAPVDWRLVALLGGGSIVGGLFGAALGRRLPDQGLRAVIVTVGTVAALRLVLG